VNNDSQLWAAAIDEVGPDPYIYYIPTTLGSWQTYRGNWCFSQAMPDGDPFTPNFIFKANGAPDMKALTNHTDPSIVRMHPIWVLPRVAD